MVRLEERADALVVVCVRAGRDEERLVDRHGEETDTAVGKRGFGCDKGFLACCGSHRGGLRG